MIQRVEGTLRDLGLVSEKDRYSLWTQPGYAYIQRPTPRSKPAYLFFYLGHPFVGKHFFQVVEETIPYHGAVFNATDDFTMPQVAQLQQPTERIPQKVIDAEKRLLRLHEDDPKIQKPFIEFASQSRAAWNTVLQTSDYDPAFDLLQNTWFVKTDTFPVRLPPNFIPDFSHLLSLQAKITLFRFQGGEPFTKFLRGFPEYEGYDSPVDIEVLFRDKLGSVRLVRRFISELPEAELGKFQLAAYAEYEKKLIVDKDTHDLYLPHQSKLNHFERVKPQMLPDMKVLLIGQNPSLRVTLEPFGKAAVSYSGYPDIYQAGIAEYDYLPEEMIGRGITPVIAIKDGRFLSQPELLQLLAEEKIYTGGIPDVFAGRVLLAYFSPEVTKTWKDKQGLKNGNYAQRMMAAQAAVRASTEEHMQDLLSDENNFAPNLRGVFS